MLTRLRLQLSLMSQSGLLEQVKLQLQNRLRKFAQQSVHVSQKYMMKLQQKQSAFSMVDLYLQLVHQNYLQMCIRDRSSIVDNRSGSIRVQWKDL